MICEGLSGVCAKLESAGCKNHDMQEVSVLQRIAYHALYKQRTNEKVENKCAYRVNLEEETHAGKIALLWVLF